MIKNILFRKRCGSSVVYPIFKNLEEQVNRRLKVLAIWLSKYFESKQARTKRLLFFGFCVVASSACIYCGVRAVAAKENHLNFSNFTIPVYTLIPDTGTNKSSHTSIENYEYARIKRFQEYMDSIKTTTDGKEKYDSICSLRPRLMDSIKYVIGIYERQ